jgi:biopolymer transport protein TolR
MARRSRIRRAPKRPKLDEVRNEINVVPLVDIVLVLLIIFMVITPLMTRGRQVELPQTRNHQESKDTQQPIVVVGIDGRLWVDQDPVASVEEMLERVNDEWKALEALNTQLAREREGEGRVLVKAEVGTPYGKVYPVIMALHDNGAVGIDLGTNEIREEE